jgi:CBS domain-containing protein
MNLGGQAKRIRIYVNEGDLIGSRPAHVAILELLRREHCSGATVFRALEGFTGSQVFSTRLPVVDDHGLFVGMISRLDLHSAGSARTETVGCRL